MRGKRHLTLPVCAVFFLLSGVSLRSTAGASSREIEGASSGRAPLAGTAAAQAEEFLGFDLDEERHYELGPPDALEPNELATWMIRLDKIENSGAGRRATFWLEHRREAPRTLENPPKPGEVTIALVDATLVVNEYGAPLELAYTTDRHIYDVGDESFRVEYTYDDERYEKRVVLQGVDWDFKIDILPHPVVDPEVPIGVFTFAPFAVDCLEWVAGTVIEHRTGTGDTSLSGRVFVIVPEHAPSCVRGRDDHKQQIAVL